MRDLRKGWKKGFDPEDPYDGGGRDFDRGWPKPISLDPDGGAFEPDVAEI